VTAGEEMADLGPAEGVPRLDEIPTVEAAMATIAKLRAELVEKDELLRIYEDEAAILDAQRRSDLALLQAEKLLREAAQRDVERYRQTVDRLAERMEEVVRVSTTVIRRRKRK
jgi:hypothetical protein